MSDGVLLEIGDGVAHVRLDRPHAANSVDLPAAKALAAAVDRCEADDVAVVMISGQGPRFCAGGDVRSFTADADPAAYLYELASSVGVSLQRLAELPKPVVAGVHGAVAGAGLGFVLAADLVVAERSTRFTMAFSGIGLTPDSGVSYLLPQVVGLRRALSFALDQRVIDASAALDWGLVSEVVDDGLALVRAAEVAHRLAAGPARAFGETRSLVRSSYRHSRAEHAEAEARTIAAAVTTPEARELVASFLGRP